MWGWALQGRLEAAVVATWAGKPRPCSVRHSWQVAASKLQNMAAARPPRMAVHDLQDHLLSAAEEGQLLRLCWRSSPRLSGGAVAAGLAPCSCLFDSSVTSGPLSM